MDKLVMLIREYFEEKLKAKTGWGRNEVMVCFDKACIKAVIKYANEKGINLD